MTETTPSRTGRPARSTIFVILACLLVGLTWNIASTPNGDLVNHWTDHLRHQGEACALFQKGIVIYELTYDEATRGVQLPCGAHEHLWGNIGIPYPPLALLVHAPLAWLEVRHAIAPATSHRTQVLFSVLAGLACLGVALRIAGGNKALLIYSLLWFGPLAIGTGACGFYDSMFALAALMAIETAVAGRSTSWIWCGLASALHVRGMLSWMIAWSNWEKARALRPALLCLGVAFTVPTMALAVYLMQHSTQFPLDNRMNLVRHGWILALGTMCAALLSVRRGHSMLSVSMVLACALVLLDRQTAWWHLLATSMVPFSALNHQPTRGQLEQSTIAIAWVVCCSYLYFPSRIPAPFIWTVS